MQFLIVTEGLNDQPNVTRRQQFPSERAQFLAAVADIEAGHAAGSIANPVYVAAKDVINRSIERACEKIRWGHGTYNEWPERVRKFHHEVDTVGLYIHTVPGKLKKAERFQVDHPYSTMLTAFLRELLPLATMMETVKGMAVKRQPKPVEERRVGYHPPEVSTVAQKQVVALLEAVTEETYAALRQNLRDHMSRVLAVYLDAHDARVAAGQPAPSPYDFFVGLPRRKGGIPNYDAEDIVTRLVTHREADLYKSHAPYVAKPDAAQIIDCEAAKVADTIRTTFVHKNYRKIASIIDAKGNYASGEVVGYGVDLQGLSGSFRFRFADGSHFMVTNQVVYVVNARGTAFLRFPLTFSQVVLPSGEIMPRPSEAKMNEVFTSATA